MKTAYRGLIIGALQCLMVLSIAGKYAMERTSLPRVWANATPYDPSLPIRGRYISLRLRVDVPENFGGYYQSVRLQVENSRLTATLASGAGLTISKFPRGWILAQPVAFFIPDNVPDPSQLKPGEELWVEVSVPKTGLPRPLRLAIKKDGTMTPLQFR